MPWFLVSIDFDGVQKCEIKIITKNYIYALLSGASKSGACAAI